MVVPGRQGLAQKGHIDEASEASAVIVARKRAALHDHHVKIGMPRFHPSELGSEHEFAAVAHAIEQVNRAIGLQGERGARHREQWRNADATCNQHDHGSGIVIEHKNTSRRAHPKNRAGFDAIVEIGGNQPW
jgi:hypothetical protein